MSVNSPVSIDNARSMLDQLLADSRLYHKGPDYHNLLDFAVRLRNFAPFNALLLQIQKPGLNHAASAIDWLETFGRTIKVGARPLLILWPFGPVALVYDLMDTEGELIPDGIYAFSAKGKMSTFELERFAKLLEKKGIAWIKVDAGDLTAGSIQRIRRATRDTEKSSYQMRVNRNHDPNVQFSTLAHELAHLFLGHLGRDGYLRVPDRASFGTAKEELEAESAAYIVCTRNGVQPKSQSYLANYVKQDTNIAPIDLYQIMRAAGQIETVLGLTAHTKLSRHKRSDVETMPLFPGSLCETPDLF